MSTLLCMRSRLAAAVALLALVVLGGCGSSSSNSSSITVGSEPAGSSSTPNLPPPVHSGAGTTPTSGPLSKEPKIVPPSGPAPSTVVTKDLVKGTGAAAQDGDTLTLNYVGALYNGGHVFDASWKRGQAFTMQLGAGQVIKGLDQGLVGMKVGGRREVIIPGALGYGAAGNPQAGIRANAPLIFVVDLLEVQSA